MVSTAYVDSLTPYPAIVAQDASQYLLWTGEKYTPTFYTTLKQKTKIKYLCSDFIDVDCLGKSNRIPTARQTRKDKRILRNQALCSLTVLTIRCRQLVHPTRSVSILNILLQSHMSTILNGISRCRNGETTSLSKSDMSSPTTPRGLSKKYLMHRLKEQFSRSQYARNSYSSPPSHAITRLAIPLKNGARNAYYTDIIGNVSTSRFRPARGNSDSHLEIIPRYPVYGGWNYTFRLGWNVDLDRVEKIQNNERILKIPFLEGPEDVQFEKLKVTIILPEGAR